MSEKLNTIVGKQNDFATRFMGGGTIPIGSSGTPVTVTPPPGQRVRLTHLSTTAGVSQTGIRVSFGGSIVRSGTVNGEDPEGTGGVSSTFSIGSYQAYPAGLPPSHNYMQWTGDTDEALTLTKYDAGATAQTVYYGYQLGE